MPVPVVGEDWRVGLVDAATGVALGVTSNALNVNITGGAGSGGTAATDEAAWTAAVSSFTPGGGVFNDSAAALTSGQMGTVRMTPNRAQHVSIRNQAGTEIIPASFPADAAAWTTAVSTFSPGGGVFNDSAAALTSGQQGTFRSTPNRGLHANLRSQNGTEILPVPAALAAATANPTLSQISTYGMVFNGTTWDPVRDLTGATNGTVGVPAAGLVVFDTVDVQNKRVNSIASAVAGGVTGKNAPALGVMKYTVAHGTTPTAFAAGVFAAPLQTRSAIPFVASGHPNSVTVSTNYTGVQTNAVVVANSAGTKIVVTSILVQASAANSVNIAVGVGLAQTVTPTSGTAGRLGGSAALAAGGGFGRKTYQAGADGDQVLTTSTGAGDYSVTVEYHLVTS